jgi:hypothetical protein
MPDNGPLAPVALCGADASDAVTRPLHFRYSEIYIAISNIFYCEPDRESIASARAAAIPA